MEFLKGYIGLSSSVSTAASGLYVDALPDISLVQAEKIADKVSEELPADAILRIWGEIEQRSLAKFRTLFFKEINGCFKIAKRDKIECLIEENKELLATSLWYLFGSEFLLEKLNSSRINRFTTIDKVKAKELRNELMNLFQNELESAIQGIDLETSTCFSDDDFPAHNAIISTHTPIL